MAISKLVYPAKENAVQEKINEIIDGLGGGGTIVVDQTFDGTSINPQSGVAIEGELANYTPTSGLATVATTGSYTSLTNRPTIGNGTINIKQDGESQTFTTNQTNSKLIKLKGLYDYYVINATLQGSPTINGATVSGMSSNNWVTTAYTAPGANEVFAISTQFVTDVPSDFDDEAQIIISDSFSTPNFALRIDGEASGVEDNLSVCVNGTWYNLSDTTILTGEVYQAKLINFMYSDGQTAAGTYLYVYSATMDEVIYDGLVTSDTYSVSSSVFYFGSGNNGAYPLNGSIDLSQTYIEQNDIVGGGTFDNGWYTVWTGATPIIDAKADKTDLNGKADTDLANVSSISSSSEVYTQLAGKAVTSLTNTTATGNIKMAEASLPSDSKRKNLTLGASGTTYNATSSGWVMFSKASTAAGQRVRIITRATGDYNTIDYSCWSTASGQVLSVSVPVLKGQTFSVYYDSSSTTNQYFRFTYAVGSESEAS